MQKSFLPIPSIVTLVCTLLIAGFIGVSQKSFAQEAAQKDGTAVDKDTKSPLEKSDEADSKWSPLFNGKNLDGWKVTNFGGEGDVYLEKGNVVISQGADLSGITSTRKDLPRVNYEIEFEAQRAIGNDFFAGLTFPVKDSHCSLICGGWGGGVVGVVQSGWDGRVRKRDHRLQFV